MHPILAYYRDEFYAAVEHFKKELGGIRTGRANAAIVENISVLAYGSPMTVKGLASISVPDAKTIAIDPWDKSVIKEIEKGIRDAGVGLNPVNEGTLLRLTMPQPTEEGRKQLIKVVREKLEECRVTIRSIREKAKTEIAAAEENNDIAEDDRYKLQDELEKVVAEFNDNVKTMAEEKENEIMTI